MTERVPTGETTDETESTDRRGDERLDPASIDAIDTDLSGTTFVVLVALVGLFTVLAGPAGSIGGLVTAAVWYAVGTPYAVAMGHVALIAVFPNGIDPLSFVIVETTFGVLLLTTVPQTAVDARVRHAVATLGSAAILGAAVWTVLGPANQPVWIAALALLTTLACGVYGLYRYGLVVAHDWNERHVGGPDRQPDRLDAEPITRRQVTTDGTEPSVTGSSSETESK